MLQLNKLPDLFFPTGRHESCVGFAGVNLLFSLPLATFPKAMS
jgi:hypothetical protein